MVNRRISKDNDPLILMSFQLFESQRKYLNDMHKLSGKSKSEILRGLILSQMDTHEVEISALEEELRQKEASTNILKSQISERKASDQRKQAASKTREQLIEDSLKRLLGSSRIINFKDNEFIQMFKNNLKDANRALNGDGEPITDEELKNRVVLKAKERKVSVRV